MKFIYPEGATPLMPDDIHNLLPSHILTQSQLNAWEQLNILQAEAWAFSRKHKSLLTLPFIQKLHHKMFEETWKWAGKFRRYQTNIGCEWIHIPIELRTLCEDVAYQLENSSFPVDEAAARFHHRLVLIHPFPNGNGRCSRLMTDLLLAAQGCSRFSWGRESLSQETTARKEYINALRKADEGDISPLLHFVRR